ncbi:MAG: hypothetical protein L6R37_005167 [Teloschistes peruensis]|nr:MAG: hypothetical protein L6R37_005167 [Teloschistes peruensis]
MLGLTSSTPQGNSVTKLNPIEGSSVSTDFRAMLESTNSSPQDNSAIYFKPDTLKKLIYESDETTEEEESDEAKEKRINLKGYKTLTVTLNILVEARQEHINRHLDHENLTLVEMNILKGLRCLGRSFDRRHDCNLPRVRRAYFHALTRLVAKLGCHHERKNSEVKCTFRPLHQMIAKTKVGMLKEGQDGRSQDRSGRINKTQPRKGRKDSSGG